MKPNFALNITDAAVSLLHRTSRGWMEVGSAAFDSPDLEEALGYLRSSALGLSPHGITTKLILPPSQVLYIEVEAPGPDKAAREAQIRTALEGKTPYALEDLVFDWWGTGPVVQVAVVARETLEEAEGFAETHRFNPVSFVTIPSDGQFAGEPWFGTSKGAAALLPDGEKVTRDQDPVKVITREMPKAAPKEEPQADVAPAPVEDTTEADRKATEAAHQAQEAARQAEAEAAAMRRAEAAAKAEADAAAIRQAEDAVRLRAEAAKAEMETRAQDLAQAEAKRLVEEAEKTKTAMLDREKARAALIEAERLRAAAEADAQAEQASLAFNGIAEPRIADPEIADTKETAPTFASRRREDGATTAPSVGPAAPTVVIKPQAPLAADKPKMAGPAAPTITAITPSRAAPVATPGATSAPATAKPLNGTAAFAQGAKPQLATTENASLGKGVAAAIVTAARIPGKATALSRFKSKVVADPMKTAPARGDASMGKMGAKLAARRGKPRFLGLIMTLVLLAALAAVAAWSSLYLSRNSAGPDPIQQAAAPQTAPVDAGPTAETAPIADAEAVADAEAELPPADEIANPVQPDTLAPQVATSDEAAQIAGPGLGAQDEIIVAATDGQPPAFDVAALPRPQTNPDGAPNAAMPPPPFGTQYEFDADGRIKATANGVIMPDGFWLIAARPPILPPARPAALSDPAPPAPATPEAAAAAIPPPANPAADAAPASTAGLVQQEGSSPSSAFTADQTVENRRPRGRPASLDVGPTVAPAAAPTDAPAQADDDASLTVATPIEPRVTSLRPRARPKAVVAAAASARKAAEAASLAATAAAEAKAAAQTAAQAEAATLQTAGLSPRPAQRPQDLSRAVAAAVSAASRETSRRQASAAAPAPEPKAKAKAEPEEEHEPEVKASAAPRIPTRANVASQATFKNAINLSKTNLIGVYGSDSKRYALIRTSSGRYNKVRVGDKVDGGTVAAITRNELRYKKGSKMLVLAMPNG